MSTQQPRLNFPKILKVSMRHFTLYSSMPVITEQFPDGVFCLAGANGLGKSTFLSAVNYGITGTVSDPRKFESFEEYYRFSIPYSTEFFDGRIGESDREQAEVEIDMRVAGHLYSLTRGVFEPCQLRRLSIADAVNPTKVIVDCSDLTPEQRHAKYAAHVAGDVGVEMFEQFVFLQHFLLTFDERRHLLFWDRRVLEQALYLAFSVNRDNARRADTLRREVEKHASRARNANWQATEIRKKMKSLESEAGAAESADEVDIGIEHQRLSGVVDSERTTLDGLEDDLRDASLRIADLTARQVSLRSEYDVQFSAYLARHPAIVRHPMIASSVAERRCALCGADRDGVADDIRSRADAEACPLCGGALVRRSPDPQAFEVLEQLDRQMTDLKDTLSETLARRERLSSDLDAARARLAGAEEALANFERENESVLDRVRRDGGPGDGIATVIHKYREQMEERLKAKRTEYALRDQKQRELDKLQADLETRYRDAEQEFLPLFKDLAEHFLGLDLSVRMDKSASEGVGLVLEVQGTARRRHHQLSESQRLFVDIALRMALAQHMSSPEGKASLFIDTPEGSLDIAYENQAGEMLAKFVKAGFGIIMTANINTSRLLQALARECGSSKMRLCRMTAWTELSDVQLAAESLFDFALAQIEQALAGGGDARNA